MLRMSRNQQPPALKQKSRLPAASRMRRIFHRYGSELCAKPPRF